ncbi:hypothetical protein Y032_0009g766 [Ancylostoma ceylanicum]|nr:hypothetical protein Y032_0009g766 [Ancylostoma ceylanicum]
MFKVLLGLETNHDLEDEPLYLNIEREESPLIVNVDRNGYFRQNYDVRGWKNIVKQLKEDHEVYSERTRFGLISDAFAAAQIGRLDYETVFQLLDYVPKEESSLVWYMVKNGLDTIAKFYGNEPDNIWAKRYAEKLMRKRAKRITRNITSKEQEEVRAGMPSKSEDIPSPVFDVSVEEPNSRKILSKRSEEHKASDSSLNDFFDGSFIEAYCKFGPKNCSSTFRSVFEKEVQHRCGDNDKASQCVRLPRHFRGITYCYGVKKLGGIALEKVKNLYKLEDDEEEKKRLTKGMSCASKVSELKGQLLNALERTGGIRISDIVMVFNSVSVNPTAEEFMVNFLIEKWEMIIARFRGEFKQIEGVINACLGKLRSEGQIMLVSVLFEF